MFLTFLDKLGGFFDRRFIIAFWMPVFVFVCLVGGTWIVLRGVTPALTWWNTKSVTETTTLLGVVLFAITLLAFLLQSFSTPLLRLYAGYWPITWLRKWGEARQSQKRKLALAKEVTDWYYEFSRLNVREGPQPTRLGNVLLAAYDYSGEIYGANATIWWSRLSPLLPEAFRTQVDNALTPLFALANLCTLTIVATLCGSILVALMNQRWWLLLVYLLGGVGLARLCYSAAVSQAVAYGEQVRVGFDLYRNELAKQMRAPLPKSPWEERELWKRLGRWISKYVPPWQPEPKETAPPQHFFYEEPPAAQHEETTISIDGKPLLKMTNRNVVDVPDPPPAPAPAVKSQKPEEQTNPKDTTKQKDQTSCARTDVAATAVATPTKWVRLQGWIFRRSMAWSILILLVAMGAVEFWWMQRGTLTRVIALTHDVPALALISSADVTETLSRTPPAGALKSVDEAAGRISLSALASGTVLDSEMLSLVHQVAATNLQGRQVISLPADDASSIVVGEGAILLGLETPANKGKEKVITISPDAISLGVHGGRLLLALRDDEVKNLAPYVLAQRRFLVLRKLELPAAPDKASKTP